MSSVLAKYVKIFARLLFDPKNRGRVLGGEVLTPHNKIGIRGNSRR
jgi:hypothetical protein